MTFSVVILVAFTVSSCGGAHILALFPVGSKSHTLAVMPIIEVNLEFCTFPIEFHSNDDSLL